MCEHVQCQLHAAACDRRDVQRAFARNHGIENRRQPSEIVARRASVLAASPDRGDDVVSVASGSETDSVRPILAVACLHEVVFRPYTCKPSQPRPIDHWAAYGPWGGARRAWTVCFTWPLDRGADDASLARARYSSMRLAASPSPHRQTVGFQNHGAPTLGQEPSRLM
jgi:hypothetical protein